MTKKLLGALLLGAVCSVMAHDFSVLVNNGVPRFSIFKMKNFRYAEFHQAKLACGTGASSP